MASLRNFMLAAIAASASTTQALAADAPADANERVVSVFVALGGAIVPEYAGSKHYKAAPFGVANIDWRDLQLQIRGPEARLDLSGDNPWSFGPVVKYRGDRDDDVKGPVQHLPKLDGSLDVGGFVGYAFKGGGEHGQGDLGLKLTALQGVAGENDGLSVKGEVSYAALRWGPLYADLDAGVTYGNRKFNDTYFGVTESGAARSGLRRYRAGSGLSDVGAGLTLGYQIDEQWGVLARASVTHYVGEAADSPIVKDGARTSGLLGLGVTYRY
ncbi:MipA/OmpV family protein [Hansschlegelia quercus]|uniref:MipA/OmpV family protein n=1 Tax=Hansschlegelia quercus TaxID=2528245 RepID=UPI0013EEF4F1|nr:MipA/OmpV family protein [Hansschlegelia quercus]